jgi:hypothetical protein
MKISLVECDPIIFINLGIQSVKKEEFIWGEKEVRIVDATTFREYVMFFDKNNSYSTSQLNIYYKGNSNGHLLPISLNESKNIRENQNCCAAKHIIEFYGDEVDQLLRIVWTIDHITPLGEFKFPKLYLVKYEYD